MKTNRIWCLAMAVMLLASCHDDIPYGQERQEGYLYFNVSEGHGWADGNKATRAGVEAPILMENTLEGQPVYLHTEVAPTMSPQLEEALAGADLQSDSTEMPQTRGIRYTGDVFSVSSSGSILPKISNIGVYATRTADRGVILSYANIGPDNTQAYSGSNYNYLWNIKEQEIEDVWDSGTADFYGYAPYFANPSSENGLSMTADANGVPTLSYTVPSDVTKQLDILTAKHLGVAKKQDVELEFTHIMSAIKFNFKHGKGTTDKGGTWSEKDNFKWSDGLDTYDVTVKTIQIQNVYTTGTWQVGADPDDGARWTRTADTKSSFTYDNVDKALTGASSPVDLNPDTEGNVFMMLPQQVPDDAKILLTCELTKEGDSKASKTMTLQAALKETDGTTAKTWLPGYTYTYTISLSDFVYVFDYNTAESKSYTDVPFAGTSEEDIFIRSYKIDSKGNMTAVDWEPQYKVEVSEVTGIGGSETHEPTWKTGSNGWIHVFDHSSGNYDTEVLAKHAGAKVGDEDNVRLFKIQIGSIMTPIIDLSLWNQTQTKKWTGRSTSNCYIVAGPGTYRIPLIYGNAWANGKENSATYKPGVTGKNVLTTFLNHNGDAIKSPFINIDLDGNVKDAVLIWEEGDGTSRTNKGGNGSNSGTVVKVISEIDTSVTGEDSYNTDNSDIGTKSNANYLQFEVSPDNFNYGNAVVGIRDKNDKIVWSWHIWMVDASWFLNDTPLDIGGHQIYYAKTNIGWVDGGIHVDAETRKGDMRLVQSESGNKITITATQQKRNAFDTYFTNVFYQWGRKDPMRGNVNADDNKTDNGAPRGVAGVQPWTNEYGTKFIKTYTQTVQQMIENPNTIYGNNLGDLYTDTYYNLWAAKNTSVWKRISDGGGSWYFHGKTIYDPSPVGYCVPPSKYLTELRNYGKYTELDAPFTLPIVCTYTHTASSRTIMFHAAGNRTTNGGYDLRSDGFSAKFGDAAGGRYHTATPYSDDECWQLRLYFYQSASDTHNTLSADMNDANCVLPVRWSGEAIAEAETE